MLHKLLHLQRHAHNVKWSGQVVHLMTRQNGGGNCQSQHLCLSLTTTGIHSSQMVNSVWLCYNLTIDGMTSFAILNPQCMHAISVNVKYSDTLCQTEPTCSAHGILDQLHTHNHDLSECIWIFIKEHQDIF